MSKGGMRFGAGRPAYKSKSGNFCGLDVRAIARKGYLNYNGRFSWQWHRGSEPTGSITISVQAHSSMTLHYTTTANGESRSVMQPVALTYSPCHFGKPRPWLRCPHCNKRVAILYLRWGVFRCRVCQRVAYASQSEIVIDRLWRKQRKIEAHLDGDWQRPKGMHVATYERLLDELYMIEEARENELAIFSARLMQDIICLPSLASSI